MNDIFNPPFYISNTFTQTLLASSKMRTWGKNPMLNVSKEVLINPIGDVKLQGFYSPQPNGQSRGMAMLLHGWEGSVNSAYILRTGRVLYGHGFSVFRLNYRDHGNTYHLNSGLFYAVLLDEVFGAIQQIANYESELPFHLIGFSMGGNFALRVSRKCAEVPIRNMKHIVSISPVLDPEKSTKAIDNYPLLRKYFRKKWSRSLLKKQTYFPALYDFSNVLTLETIAEMTEVMIQRYSEYESSSDYFRHYAVLGDALADLTVPTAIITAQDDPIIPVEDFYNLKLHPTTDLFVHRHGGHNGFLETLSGRAWYEKKILDYWMA
ncbi:MAG: alpha/beta fold hydrolase [Anaerolineales bacterium]